MDDGEVDIRVACREAWERLAKDDQHVNVELLTQHVTNSSRVWT